MANVWQLMTHLIYQSTRDVIKFLMMQYEKCDLSMVLRPGPNNCSQQHMKYKTLGDRT